jgi:hypothetical protein
MGPQPCGPQYKVPLLAGAALASASTIAITARMPLIIPVSSHYYHSGHCRRRHRQDRADGKCHLQAQMSAGTRCGSGLPQKFGVSTVQGSSQTGRPSHCQYCRCGQSRVPAVALVVAAPNVRANAMRLPALTILFMQFSRPLAQNATIKSYYRLAVPGAPYDLAQ